MMIMLSNYKWLVFLKSSLHIRAVSASAAKVVGMEVFDAHPSAQDCWEPMARKVVRNLSANVDRGLRYRR